MELRYGFLATLRCPHVSLSIGVQNGPAGEEEHDRAFRDRPVLALEGREVRDAHEVVAVLRCRGITSMTMPGPINWPTGIWSASRRPSAKWMGASTWVPPCSAGQK